VPWSPKSGLRRGRAGVRRSHRHHTAHVRIVFITVSALYRPKQCIGVFTIAGRRGAPETGEDVHSVREGGVLQDPSV
jgi:hypothetical protein